MNASGERNYNLVELDGGKVLVADITGLTSLERRLWLIARERRQPVGVIRPELCAACGTPRVAFFRWCQTCGRDFESDRERPPEPVVLRLPTSAPTPVARARLRCRDRRRAPTRTVARADVRVGGAGRCRDPDVPFVPTWKRRGSTELLDQRVEQRPSR